VNQQLSPTETPLSILFLGTQIAVGGAQKVLFDQAGWFHMHGHRVTVAFLYDRDGLFNRWSRAVDYPLHNLGAFEKGAGVFQQARLLSAGLWRLWRLLKRGQFDVIETFTHDSNILGLLLAWLAGVPVRIASHHGKFEGLPLWKEHLHAWLVNQGIAQALVTVSKRTQQIALEEGIHPDRITVIPNGITPLATAADARTATRQSLGIEPDELFLLSVGRLVHQKGHEFLVQALAEAASQNVGIKAGICGEGVLRPMLESAIQARDLGKRFQLLGEWLDVAPALAAADAFVLPSRWEGLPMALLEAMAAGLPVIATRVEGVDEVVTEGVHGHLVVPEDSQALAQAILQLAADADARKRMGAAAQARVLQEYTTAGMCGKYYVLMLSLFRKPRT
jgi:glycosyltransferase involved in cell wall biosynthesis